MAASLTLDLDARRFLREIIAKGPEKVEKQLRIAFKSIGRAFVSKQKTERLTGGTTATRLAVRENKLRRSIGFVMQGDTLESLTLFTGFGPPAVAWASEETMKAAHVHATGMLITPVKVQYLAIPIADNLTGTGIANFDSPRELGDPRFVPWLGDSFLVFDGDELMFVLKRSVFVPKRLDIPGDWQDFTPTIMEKLRNALSKAIKGLQRG